jgi:hypothetical protein
VDSSGRVTHGERFADLGGYRGAWYLLPPRIDLGE